MTAPLDAATNAPAAAHWQHVDYAAVLDCYVREHVMPQHRKMMASLIQILRDQGKPDKAIWDDLVIHIGTGSSSSKQGQRNRGQNGPSSALPASAPAISARPNTRQRQRQRRQLASSTMPPAGAHPTAMNVVDLTSGSSAPTATLQNSTDRNQPAMSSLQTSLAASINGVSHTHGLHLTEKERQLEQAKRKAENAEREAERLKRQAEERARVAKEAELRAAKAREDYENTKKDLEQAMRDVQTANQSNADSKRKRAQQIQGAQTDARHPAAGSPSVFEPVAKKVRTATDEKPSTSRRVLRILPSSKESPRPQASQRPQAPVAIAILSPEGPPKRRLSVQITEDDDEVGFTTGGPVQISMPRTSQRAVRISTTGGDGSKPAYADYGATAQNIGLKAQAQQSKRMKVLAASGATLNTLMESSPSIPAAASSVGTAPQRQAQGDVVHSPRTDAIRKQQQETRRKEIEEREARLKLQAEKQKAIMEEKRRLEEDRMRRYREEEAERERKAEKERLQREEARLRQEEEGRKRQEEDLKQRKEAERRQREEQERCAREEGRKKQEEEERRQREKQDQRALEEARKVQEEKDRKQKEEQERRALEEARKKREEIERREREEQERRAAEEARKKREDEERKEREEIEKKRIQEEERRKRKAEEEQRRRQELLRKQLEEEENKRRQAEQRRQREATESTAQEEERKKREMQRRKEELALKLRREQQAAVLQPQSQVYTLSPPNRPRGVDQSPLPEKRAAELRQILQRGMQSKPSSPGRSVASTRSRPRNADELEDGEIEESATASVADPESAATSPALAPAAVTSSSGQVPPSTLPTRSEMLNTSMAGTASPAVSRVAHSNNGLVNNHHLAGPRDVEVKAESVLGSPRTVAGPTMGAGASGRERSTTADENPFAMVLSASDAQISTSQQPQPALHGFAAMNQMPNLGLLPPNMMQGLNPPIVGASGQGASDHKAQSVVAFYNSLQQMHQMHQMQYQLQQMQQQLQMHLLRDQLYYPTLAAQIGTADPSSQAQIGTASASEIPMQSTIAPTILPGMGGFGITGIPSASTSTPSISSTPFSGTGIGFNTRPIVGPSLFPFGQNLGLMNMAPAGISPLGFGGIYSANAAPGSIPTQVALGPSVVNATPAQQAPLVPNDSSLAPPASQAGSPPPE